MKYLPSIAGGLLGLLFIAGSVAFLLGAIPPQDPPPAGSAEAMFMGAFIPTGYMTFLKICELIGGIFLVVPKTRNFGLLLLGPILVNIIAFHVLVKGDGIFNPIMIVICAISLYLLWVGRKAFAGLLN